MVIWFKVRSCCLYVGDMTNGSFGKATLNHMCNCNGVCKIEIMRATRQPFVNSLAQSVVVMILGLHFSKNNLMNKTYIYLHF